MRRQDRAVTALQEIQAILERCQVCRLAMADTQGLYIVPMNYGFTLDGAQLTLYFHCAREGRKIDALTTAPQVAFEMDGGHQLTGEGAACNYSFNYECVTGTGTVHFCTTAAEKIAGLQAIMTHMAGKEFLFTDAMVENVCVFQVVADSYSAKARRES